MDIWWGLGGILSIAGGYLVILAAFAAVRLVGEFVAALVRLFVGRGNPS